MRASLALIMTLVLAILPAAEPAQGWYEHREMLYFNIDCTLRFHGENQALADAIWKEWKEIDGIFNDYKEDSEISRINAGSDGTYECSPLLTKAFAEAIQVEKQTEGAFSVTVGPLRRLWKGAVAAKRLPESASIAALLPLMGPKAFSLNGSTLTKKDPKVSFDFGGIVKGMAVDLAVARLQAAGIQRFLVQVGGETACKGLSPKDRPARLGIPDPKDLEAMWCIVADPGTGLCLSTSGNYRQPIVIDGKTLYHIYDPRSGEPCDTRVLSVTVVWKGLGHNTWADAMTKGGVVLDPKTFIRIAESHGAETLILTQHADGTVVAQSSSAWKNLLITPPPESP